MNDFIFDFDDSIPEFDIVVQHVTTEGGGGGQTIEIDSELSTTSNNPVKNKVITQALNGKVSSGSLATVATSGSYNDLTNKPIIPSSFPVDVELDDTSSNPVQNAVITNALGDKMDYPRGGISGQVLQKTAEGAQWASIGTPSQEQIDAAVEEYIEDHPGVISGLSEAAKVALLQIAQKVAYVDEDGQDYYDALYDAFYPPAELVGITAVYTQSGTVYDTDSLDDLKSDLVVTALYSDSTSAVITSGYTLSGTLTAGTSTITVAYGGQTATFNVTVTHKVIVSPIYSWDLTASLTDTVGGIVATTTATFTQGTGLVFNTNSTYADFGAVFSRDRTYELDVQSVGTVAYSTYRRILMVDTDDKTSQGGAGLLYSPGTNNRYGWWFYLGSTWAAQATYGGSSAGDYLGVFDGKTLKVYLDANGVAYVYTKNIGADDSTYQLIGSSGSALNNYTNGHVYIGSSSGDSIANATFTGLRVYEGEK